MLGNPDDQDNPNGMSEFSNDAEALLHSEVFGPIGGQGDSWDQPD